MKQDFKWTLFNVGKRFFTIPLTLSLLIGTTSVKLHAQAYKLNQVIVLNDGNRLNVNNGSYATIGSYNPATKVYQDFDVIRANFGCCVIIDSGFIYAAVDSLLIKYNLNTKARLLTQTVVGIREIAVWGNQILVTRGTTFPLKSYFQVYDKHTLNLLYQDTTVSHASQGIKVLGDSAYIAINDFGSGSMGNLGVIDLKAQKEKHEVNLGPSGLNPYDVEVDPLNKKIYTVNDLTFSNSTVTKYDAPTVTFTNTSLNLTASCTGSTYYIGNVYFQAGNDYNIGEFSTSSLSVWDSLKIKKYVYGLSIDSADGYVYVGQTDYVSYGKVFVYNLFGQAVDSFQVDVGPGNFAFDISSVNAVPETNISIGLSAYPNPAVNEIYVKCTDTYNERATLSLIDVLGRTVYQTFFNTGSPLTIPLNGIPSGVYFIKVETANSSVVKQIVKQ